MLFDWLLHELSQFNDAPGLKKSRAHKCIIRQRKQEKFGKKMLAQNKLHLNYNLKGKPLD